MWLAFLRRLAAGHSYSRPSKRIRPERQRIIPRLDYLEDRTLLSSGGLPYATPSTPAQLIADINAANSAGGAVTITLASGVTFDFTTPYQSTLNALPVITGNITLKGNNDTIQRNSSSTTPFRLFDVAAGATLTLENLTLTGGLVSGASAQGGAVYNSGNLSMKSVVVGGNQALGGNGQNGEGGGIYSNGGSLTLVHDVIGRTTHQTRSFHYTSSGFTSKHMTSFIGNTNQAVGGSGGSGQGAGLYILGGTVKISNATLAGNYAVGGTNGNAQGGAIYANGASLTLVHTIIGGKPVFLENLPYASGTTTLVGSPNQATGGGGGSAQGAGLYTVGGTVKISSAAFGGNYAYGGALGTAQGGGIYASGGSVTLVHTLVGGRAKKFYNSTGKSTKVTGSGAGDTARAGVGGTGQGGGIYANAITLTLTDSVVGDNRASGGPGIAGANGSANLFAGGAGGDAQGGGIYAKATTISITGGAVSNNDAQPGSGGNGAPGTSKHPTGGAGGPSGIGQGGGIYLQGGSLTISNAASIFANNVAPFFYAGGAGGAGYNSNGIYGAGGPGGSGKPAEGGNVFASNAPVVVESGTLVNEGQVFGAFGGPGGAGGKGQAGGQGGDAGFVAGGGLYVANGSVIISDGAGVNDNTLFPGWGGYGGNGGIGGNGGNGGVAKGGGLYALNTSVTLTDGTGPLSAPTLKTPGLSAPGINVNTAGPGVFGRGGNGGSGTAGPGGNGGAGSWVQGGGVFISGSNLDITLGSATLNAAIEENAIIGGDGGNGGIGHGGANGVGGAGGSAIGGGMFVQGNNTITLINASIVSDLAMGGNGGNGASSGYGVISNFGNGGDAQGGGLFVFGSSHVTALNSTFAGDEVVAGTGTSGGIAVKGSPAKYGLAGTALGGGIYADYSNLNILNSTFAINLLAAGAGNPNVNTVTSAQVTGGGTAQGGGLYAVNGTLSLINDTIAWNYLITYNRDSNLANPVFPGGSVMGQGGGLYNGPSNTLNLENTIIALDLVFSDVKYGETNAYATYNDFASDPTASLLQNDANLIGGVGGINDANLVPGASEQLFAVPLYTNNFTVAAISGQLPGDYGGLSDTLPLAWNTSPAVSNGDPSAAATLASYEGVAANATTDQRGQPRIINNTIDIGATQTQVSLNGSPSVTTVQAGGTITYTLTVTNHESTPANVTLTDILDPNTTYQSSNGTNWTITPPSSSSSGGTLTATISLAPNSTATLTITVTVAANVASNTTLVNTASIAPTGNSLAGSRSVTMNTQTQGATNITSEIRIIRTPVIRDRDDGPQAYVQGALLVNNSGTILAGPIALVLVGLPSDVTLTNASGYYNGSPYILLVPPDGFWKPGWWNFLLIILEFSTANPADIKYTPEILQGI